MSAPEKHPGYIQFYRASSEHIGRAMRDMSDTPEAKRMPRDAMLTALACACIRTCALTVTPSDMTMADVEWFSKELIDQVKIMRQRAADMGLTRRSQ